MPFLVTIKNEKRLVNTLPYKQAGQELSHGGNILALCIVALPSFSFSRKVYLWIILS